ncbi:MAG: tetratricopeptide repeat protein [Bacteroidota bacterium]
MQNNFLRPVVLLLLLIPYSNGQAQENLQELFYTGGYAGVIRETTQSMAAGDTSFITFYMKAQSEAQLGQTGNAISTLQGALEYHPDDIRIRRMLALQYSLAGDYVKARENFLVLVCSDSTDVSSWLKLAEIASFRQRYGEAIHALEQALVYDTLNLEGLMMMGELLNRNNNNGTAAFYEKALRLYPDNQKAASALGNWYIQAKRADEAIPVCEHMLQLDSTSIKFNKLMGYAQYKAGKPFPAIQQFGRAIELGDSSEFAYKFMGICQYLTASFPEAIESLRIASRKDSMDAEIFFFLGASLATTHEKKEAMNKLDKSMKLMQPDPAVASRIYSEQGNIKRLEEEYEQAYALYGKAWETDTVNIMALYFMASIQDNSLHHSEQALVDYQRFIDQLDLKPPARESNSQIPSIRAIVEDRIISLKEELFFLDQD